MRLPLILFAITALASAASAHEFGMARPGGVFLSIVAENADGCAAACESDSLCMAWTWRADGACELKAVTPRPVGDMSAVSGLSSRAPAFARLITAQAPPAELRAHITLPPDPPPAPDAEDIAAEHTETGDADYGLLGGPIADAAAHGPTAPRT